MMLNIKAFNILNPGQMPVGTSDCQIYALTKEAIYCFPDKFPGYCAMFGGLDIEQCLCSLYHKLVEAAKSDNSFLEPYEWLCKKAKSSITCFYWKMVIDLEVQICIFV